MAKKSNLALVGAFVVTSIALAVVAVLIWGSRALFERKYQYVCYFPGSVNGLSRGAPVKYRGVEIGVVKDIRLRFHQAPDEHRIPATIELWGKRLQELGGNEPTPELVDELVAHGLRARLASSSLLTGVMYISFDEAPGTPMVRSEQPGPGALPEIPTLPTEMEELTKNATQFLANLTAADYKGAIDSVSTAMQGVSQLATSGDLQKALDELPRTLTSLRRLAGTIDNEAGKAGPVIEDAQGAMLALREALNSAQGVVSPRAPLPVNVGVAVSDVDKAAVAVRELADFLRRNPHAIVAGTKPTGNPR